MKKTFPSEDWVEDPDMLSRFWGIVRYVYGIEDDVWVREQLGVSSLSEFDGTMHEALEILEANGPYE